ncbi:MAG: Fatty acid oxidation complex subunit alpha [Chlamydiae bacterium]|nr:Fatty acid oxidation complex subunit alpha [Chlamydiota bacterium]
MSSSFKLTIDPEGIAHLVFDYPGEKINKISIPVLDELDGILEGLVDNKHIKAMLITSAKEGIFIAGADLKSFDSLFDDPDRAREMLGKGHQVFSKLEKLPFPTIAVINGVCLGGGLELALACTYRIVADHPRTSLGLPETSLGIFPGWGGTQRLPKLIGLTEGLKIILTGKPVKAMNAWKIKLADAIVPWEFQEQKVEEFVRMCLTEKGRREIISRRKRKGMFSLLFEKNFIGRHIVYWQSKRTILKKTKGDYPAPLVALEVVKKTYGIPLEKGLKVELDMFIKNMKKNSKIANYLIQIFFNSEAMKKDPGLPETKKAALPIHAVGVLGAGVMGSGISWLMSYRDIPVRMKDINWEFVGKGYEAAWDIYKTLMKIRRLKPGQANLKFHNITGTIDYTGFRHLDLIIEAAVENIDLKHKILQELEGEIRPDAIVATNTSSLTIKELATVMQHPERLIGMHFFNPPSRMPLVEIVAGEKTSPEAVATAVELCKRIKKMPIVVGDCSGFLVNRIFARGFVETMRMLDEGIDMQRIDKIFLKFGMPMAPFVLADKIGNDVNLKAFKGFESAYPDRMHVPHILDVMVEQELYGEKVRKGFYLYQKKSKKPNPKVQEIITSSEEAAKISDEEIVERVVLAMINEAARCLQEKIVTKPGYLDIAMIFGTGFPPFRGGVLRYADSLGIKNVVSKLKYFQQTQGERYSPTELLLEMDKENRGFY